MATATRPVHRDATGSADGRRTTKRIWNNPFLIGAALLVAVVFLQWPMFKGMFYKLSGVEAPSSAVAWRDDFQKARGEAASSEKPVLLVFSAEWCPACIAMQHGVWADADVGKVANERFVPVYVDVDDREHTEVATRYGISAIPAVLIVDKEGRVLRQAASMSRSTTLRFLSDESAKNEQG